MKYLQLTGIDLEKDGSVVNKIPVLVPTTVSFIKHSSGYTAAFKFPRNEEYFLVKESLSEILEQINSISR